MTDAICTALQVARHLLHIAADRKKSLTLTKLNMMLYMLQTESIRCMGHPFFKDTMVLGDKGPSILSLGRKYSSSGVITDRGMAIDGLDDVEDSVIEKAFDRYVDATEDTEIEAMVNTVLWRSLLAKAPNKIIAPKDMLRAIPVVIPAQLDPDICLLAVCAVRYSLGRETYMPTAVQDIVRRHIDSLDDQHIQRMINDIDESLSQGRAGDPAIDAPTWTAFSKWLSLELEKRADNR